MNLKSIFGLAWSLSITITTCYMATAQINEETAVKLLSDYIKQEAIYNIKYSCLSYITEEINSNYIQLAIREKHNQDCGGDPQTAPILDRFRILIRNSKIYRYDPIEDRWMGT